MQELYPLMNEAEVLVLAAPIYYFTLCAQIQAPIQRMYCVNKPTNVKKMALLYKLIPGIAETTVVYPAGAQPTKRGING